MAEQNLPQDNDVDLGSLFKIIGKGFQNLFKAIGKLLSTLGHYVVLFLLFLRNNAIKLGIATLLGVGLGSYLDYSSPSKYVSTMTVEPNFKSATQLYNNINFYDELIGQKNYNLLSETFDISTEEAQDLQAFDIEPIRNENEKYELFDKFIQEADTTTARNLNIKQFEKGFTDYDYKHHVIKVSSLNNAIFQKLSVPIIHSVENNPHFKNQKSINDQNLLQNEQVLMKSLREIDTLRGIYNEVLITEAKKMESGTSITLAQGVKKTEEVELFNESLKLNKELIDNNQEKAESTEIINVVSTFSKVGAKERKLTKKSAFRLGIGFGALMLIFILLRQLNSYLLNYRKND